MKTAWILTAALLSGCGMDMGGPSCAERGGNLLLVSMVQVGPVFTPIYTCEGARDEN